MVVVSIIGILAAIGIPRVFAYVRANETAEVSTIIPFLLLPADADFDYEISAVDGGGGGLLQYLAHAAGERRHVHDQSSAHCISRPWRRRHVDCSVFAGLRAFRKGELKTPAAMDRDDATSHVAE